MCLISHWFPLSLVFVSCVLRSKQIRCTDRHFLHDLASINCCLEALRHTFLSTLRSHLGQKELIPVSCDCENACQEIVPM